MYCIFSNHVNLLFTASLLTLVVSSACKPKSTLTVNPPRQANASLREQKTLNANPNRQAAETSKLPMPMDLTSNKDVELTGYRIESELSGLPSPKQNQTYVVADAKISPSAFWETTDGSFFTGQDSARLATDTGNVNSAGYRMVGESQFKTSKTTAFLPNPPKDDEEVSFAFLILRSSLLKPIHFQLGKSKPILLTDEIKNESN